MKSKERSVISWIAEFAGEKKPYYIGSVAFAFAEQFCGQAPYYIMGIIVKDLLEGVREPYAGKKCPSGTGKNSC